MTSRIGDGNGSFGRLAEIAEEARNATTESEPSAQPDAKAKGDSHKVSDGMDRETLRNVFHTWKSNANRKTSTREALKPPPPSAPTSPVEIREKKPENLARVSFEIVRRPADLSADQVTFDVRVNGRDYEMAVRGPITEAQLEKIAENSARACNVLSQSGVKSFEKATLESSGGVRVDNPQLGARGPVADQVRNTMREAKLNAPLDALQFESDGSVAFQVRGQQTPFEIPAEHMRAAPFKSDESALSNLAEALKSYAQLACPELAEPDTSVGNDSIGQVIMRPITPSVSTGPKDNIYEGQLSDAPKNKMAKWDAIFEENRFLKCKSSTEEKKLQVFEVCRWDGCDYVLDAVYDQPMYIGRVEMKLNEGKKRKFIYFQTDYKIKK